MATRADITPTLLRQLLRYDPETGKLFWLQRHGRLYSSPLWAQRFNEVKAGREAFVSTERDGYLVDKILGHRFLAHRVAWAIFYGQWPCFQVDHINGLPADNRIENLRDVSGAENSKNQRIYISNKSGRIGVHWLRSAGKWRAKITVNHKVTVLGDFSDFEAAVEAREKAEKSFGFHENHGRQI